MMKYGKKKLAAVVLAFVISLSGMAWAIDLGDLIGVVGGGFIVSQVAGPLNDFINTVTFNKGASHRISWFWNPYWSSSGGWPAGRSNTEDEGCGSA